MKVAICISGTVKSNHPKTSLQINYNKARNIFKGADFYYATWESYKEEFEKQFPNDKCFYFKEPTINYHPYLDIKQEYYISKHFADRMPWANSLPINKIQWTSHHTKQILIHAWLMDKLTEQYDIIVRTRFDAFFHKDANFSKYLKDTHENGTVHGFAVTRQSMFNTFYDSPMEPGTKHEHYLLDQLIIHKADKFDTKQTLKLHDEKRLHPAEFGWYQVLSMPYGGIHKNHHGLVNHDKNVLTQFILEHR